MNQTLLWLILLQPLIENKIENKSHEFKACGHKTAVTKELKICQDKQRIIKGYQQPILNPPNCASKKPVHTVCA